LLRKQAETALARERQAAEAARGEAGSATSASAAATAQVEQKHAAEVQRLRATLQDLEGRLESRARAEHQFKRKIQELEQRAARAAAPDPAATASLAALAALQAKVDELSGELEDVRGENDFLNGEVARYTQKNRDLAARLGLKG
jgi:chromosome segregation ATPase